jgi:3-hydroxybutyryl-CoA dehydrogenase
MKLGVIGAGTMGCGIAFAIARSGFEVIVRSRRGKEKALRILNQKLRRYVENEKLTIRDKDYILSHIKVTKELQNIKGVDLVIEAVEEDVEVKKGLFTTLGEICPEETILATNTSGLSITEIASATNHPQRVIGMHFFNPALVMKLVEIIRGECTSDETFLKAAAFVKQIGKEMVEVRDCPGFIVNRLLNVMINEAIQLLQEGVASTEDDIDKAMELGANQPMGPLRLADYIGLDVCLKIMENLYSRLKDEKYEPSPLLIELVRKNRLGRKTGHGFYTY